MSNLILFNKPFRVLSQFTDREETRDTLATYLDDRACAGFYPAGRLDYDSEGLMALTNDGALQNKIASPAAKMTKVYWVQVEGLVDDAALNSLRQGVLLKDGMTAPANATIIPEPPVWIRKPPIRHRPSLATSWLQLEICEGRNRQVRRMTAAVNLPTLRLVRIRIGPWQLAGMQPGEYRLETVHLPKRPRQDTPRRRRS